MKLEVVICLFDIRKRYSNNIILFTYTRKVDRAHFFCCPYRSFDEKGLRCNHIMSIQMYIFFIKWLIGVAVLHLLVVDNTTEAANSFPSIFKVFYSKFLQSFYTYVVILLRHYSIYFILCSCQIKFVFIKA